MQPNGHDLPEITETLQTDVLVVGAGPVGIFAVFELGLLGLQAVVVDSLTKAGGQCAELYPEKPIYDIPGIPVVTGQELTDRLMEQAAPFDPVYRLGHRIMTLERRDDGRFRAVSDFGLQVEAPVVFIAAGCGSFVPRKPKVPGILELEGKGVEYAVRRKDDFKGHDIVIIGGGDSAIDWTLSLLEGAKSLTLVHRRDKFRAHPASVDEVMAAVDAGRMRFILGELGGVRAANEALAFVDVKAGGETISLPCQRLLPFFGLDMRLGPILDWQLDLENGKLIKVDTETFATSTPGIFAIGDINTYPGKLKLILSGFHEAALASRGAFKVARPNDKLRFQYTTSSSELQERLKVA
ncbi:MAG: NAD(P)/FAD-dependent oxidoreductase [Geminicoccaceae bacterium]|nr:MAG: NAD(P)/FAD-dependent oxidoreductase [Geminicoccaceae bacterium]